MYRKCHLCIDFVLFFLEVGKNPLMAANKVRHSPFSYSVFTMQHKTNLQIYLVKGRRLSAKTNVCALFNFSFSL